MKTALAGVMLERSFATFKASIAAFSNERAPSRPFGRWEFASMVGTQENGVAPAVRKDPVPNRDGRPFCHDTPRASRNEEDHVPQCTLIG